MPTLELNYNNLKVYLVTYLQNTSDQFVENLDIFIDFAQRRLATDLKILGVEQVLFIQPGDYNPNNNNINLLQKPANWKNTSLITLNFGNTDSPDFHPLVLRSLPYCEQYQQDFITVNNTAAGKPLYYGNYDWQFWYLSPAPMYPYPGEIHVLQLPFLLSEDNQTNWFTEQVPNLLLYAALYETACFLQDDARMGTWKTMYTEVLQGYLNEDKKQKDDLLISVEDD